MRNATSSRPWLFRRPRLLAVSAAGAVAVLVLASTLTLAALNLRHVHASGTGPGGSCYYMATSTTPACTFSGHTGWADAQSNSGCVSTNTWVYVSDNFARDGGTTGQSSFVYLNTYRYNSCTWDYSWGWAYDDAGTVQFSSTANTLTAQGNLTGYTYDSYGTPSPATFTLDLTWKFLGEPNRDVSAFHHQAPNFVTNLHYTGTSGSAIVTGTLSDGTTNFMTSPSTDAEWLNAQSGTFVTIQK